jgi:hypothetical protein
VIIILPGVSYISKVIFRVRWLTMSDRDRYAYLWDRTQNSLRESRIKPYQPYQETLKAGIKQRHHRN